MRTFIAIEISNEIKTVLDRIESHLKYSGADIKWVKPENIHITLKFLGEVKEEKIKELKMVLDEVGKITRPFDISIKEIGAFPRIEFPRVIWVGLDKGAAESTALAAKVEEALSGIGFQKETRPFASHLTIGRVRSPKNREALKEKVTGYKSPISGHQTVSSIILFQSTLTPKGPIYTKLHESAFRA